MRLVCKKYPGRFRSEEVIWFMVKNEIPYFEGMIIIPSDKEYQPLATTIYPIRNKAGDVGGFYYIAGTAGLAC